jgi:hypothetical protein
MQSLGVTGKELENERRDVVIVRMGVCLFLDTRTTHPSPLPGWSVVTCQACWLPGSASCPPNARWNFAELLAAFLLSN